MASSNSVESYSLNLETLTDSTNIIIDGKIAPETYHTAYFNVGSGDYISPWFNIYGFEDDLNLYLHQWDGEEWQPLVGSETKGNEYEAIFKILGTGSYVLTIDNVLDINNSNTSSNYVLEVDAEIWEDSVTIPNDPQLYNQWHLFNVGQGSGYDNIDIMAPEAWNIRTSSPNTIVAVIDTAIDLGHEDLKNNLWINSGESYNNAYLNGIDDDNNGYDVLEMMIMMMAALLYRMSCNYL